MVQLSIFLSWKTRKLLYFAKKQHDKIDQWMLKFFIGLIERTFWYVLFYFLPLFYNIRLIMWYFSFWRYSASQKSKFLNLSAVYLARFHRIYSCCVYAAVTEYISKTHDVLLQTVISACEKMTEVVGKNFFLRHVRSLT